MQIRQERVYRQSLSSLRMLTRAAREAEQLVDQTLAEDLWSITQRLDAVTRAAAQRKYRSPSKTRL